ncbi:uncharacterized protein LOC129729794 [Wyeomyia smithii]|uniref:uncharacterized protein LOC129729794 n=1 Tax=Wyeomyia smithii TaxID=174621 RepID=UPI002467AC6A|nr:uncharacterized protein LOC129729794 [Wyeomyia smithii]
MITRRMRLPVIALLCLLQLSETLASPDPDVAGRSAAMVATEDDRELKANDDGYDFLSIDQLFMNNPQYAKLLSDLQSHTFGRNWRRKRDTENEETPAESFPEELPTKQTNATSAVTGLPEITEVTKQPVQSKQTEEAHDNHPDAEGRTTPLKVSSISSTTAAASSLGFSGSTEAIRPRTEEPTTSASPVRSSTPRRLLHKGNVKNKNKGVNKYATLGNSNSSSSLTAANVNKFTVSNTPPSVTSVSSSSPAVTSSYTAAASAASSNSNMAAAAASVAANMTSPAGSSSNKDKVGLAPTKYHYYPHNQHIYFLPECAIQQVCNAVYVRLNYTQPLCACPPRYRDPCSASLNEDDNHTIKLVGNAQRKAITLAKTCENTNELRECRAPKDWSILALQNSRTGKSHYLVICKCPPHFRLEGPLAHDQPTYAGLPGINVYGMLCVPPAGTQSSAPNYNNRWKVRPSSPAPSYRSFKNASAVTKSNEY